MKKRRTRRRRSTITKRSRDGVARLFLVLLVGSALAWSLIEHPVWTVTVIAAISVAVVAYRKARANAEQARERAFLKMIERNIDLKLPALSTAKMQRVVLDPYGKPRLEKWLEHRAYFMKAHVETWVPGDQRMLYEKVRPKIVTLIEEKIEKEISSRPPLTKFRDDMTPSEFEACCAAELCAAGWNARKTMQSRDQGVDVIAEKNGLRVVLQCKLYTHPVGNKAVQEASAAKAYARAAYGVVVSNHRYTSDAEELAAANGILLLHYRELKDLDRMVGLKAKAASASLSSSERSLDGFRAIAKEGR